MQIADKYAKNTLTGKHKLKLHITTTGELTWQSACFALVASKDQFPSPTPSTLQQPVTANLGIQRPFLWAPMLMCTYAHTGKHINYYEVAISLSLEWLFSRDQKSN